MNRCGEKGRRIIPGEPRVRIRVVGPGEARPKGVVPWHERIHWPAAERRLSTVVERIPPRLLPLLRRWESPEEAKVSRQLGFPVKLMMRAQPPLFSQPISREWWVDVYREGMRPPNLPARAQERWMRACGLGLVATTLVYYERLRMKKLRRRDKVLSRVSRLFSQDFPDLRRRAMEQVQKRPYLPRLLVWGVMILSGFLALTAFAGVAVAAAVVGAVLHDPVLIVVDRTGRWIELDRWT